MILIRCFKNTKRQSKKLLKKAKNGKVKFLMLGALLYQPCLEG